MVLPKSFIFIVYVINYYLFLGYLAHYVVKRHFKFHKDPFAEFFRAGVQCWIPLDVRGLVDFQFVEKTEEDEKEKAEIQEKMIKYLERKIIKSQKRKKKRLVWREKMKKKSEEKDLKKKEKERRKLGKMSKKEKDSYVEKQRKKEMKKNEVLIKSLAAKRVRAALEYSRAQSLLPVAQHRSITPHLPEPDQQGVSLVEKIPAPQQRKKRKAKEKRNLSSAVDGFFEPAQDSPSLPKKTRTGRCVKTPARYNI